MDPPNLTHEIQQQIEHLEPPPSSTYDHKDPTQPYDSPNITTGPAIAPNDASDDTDVENARNVEFETGDFNDTPHHMLQDDDEAGEPMKQEVAYSVDPIPPPPNIIPFDAIPEQG